MLNRPAKTARQGSTQQGTEGLFFRPFPNVPTFLREDRICESRFELPCPPRIGFRAGKMEHQELYLLLAVGENNALCVDYRLLREKKNVTISERSEKNTAFSKTFTLRMPYVYGPGAEDGIPFLLTTDDAVVLQKPTTSDSISIYSLCVRMYVI